MIPDRLAIAALGLALGAALWCGPGTASPARAASQAGAASQTGAESQAGAAAIDPSLAARYFAEADSLCAADGGRLWGRPLGGPLLFIDRATHRAVASRADTAGVLVPVDGVYAGRLPATVIPANSALRWGGVHWTMLIWPLPADSTARRVLLVHELWHHVQDALGFPATSPDNSHLDTPESRLWLRLEWRALAKALRSEGAARRAAITDALVFRAYRRSLAPGSAESERALEMHEGLAEYTGFAAGIGDPAAARARAAEKLSAAEQDRSYVRSFAYASGPAYGLLLDETAPGWRKGLTPAKDLGRLLGRAIGFAPPDSGLREEARRRWTPYGGEPLALEEWNRGVEMEKRQATLRVRFVDGPILILPLRNARYGFDPNNVQPLGTFGTIYYGFTATDEWGVLTAPGGALLAKDWSTARVPSPADSARTGTIHGDGWTLDLRPGWRLEPGTRRGDFMLRK